MAKLIKRLGNGFWQVQEFSWKPKLKRKLYREVTPSGKIERYVKIDGRKVKVFMK